MSRASKEATDGDKNITVRMTFELLDRLDECRRRERDLPNRSEMIRRLLSAQLDEMKIP